jgi:hypothetical protein
MPGYLENTITALVYDLSALYDGPDAGPYPAYNDVVRFVMAQLDRMPSFLALAIRLATAGFGCSRLLTDGSLFHRRDAQRRRAQLDAWKRSRLGPCQDLMKFYSSLVVLAVYSRVGQTLSSVNPASRSEKAAS